MKRLRTFFVASAAMAALIAGAPAAWSEPAMWVVKDKDSEIRLFGTVHVLPKELSWRSAAFDAAFAGSQEVWFEMDLSPDGQKAAQTASMQFGLSPDRPLSAVLTPEQRARVKAAADQLGIPDAQLEPMRPWLVGLTFSLVQIMRAGYDPSSGVERVLQPEIGARPAKSFETAEQQIRFFADLPDATQVAFLMNSIDDMDRGPQMLSAMVADWAEGDVAGLETVFLSEMRTRYADLYDVLIKRRNEAWVDRIVAELQGSGTDFIAVGAGHLVGPDGVPALLTARGVTVERVGAEPKVKPRRRAR